MLEIETLLREKLGLEITSVGRCNLKHAVRKRMEDVHIDDLNSYTTLLTSSKQELNELVEEVVVPETWFFRDTQPFIVLTSYVAKKLAKNPDAFIRLISSPCSTGEEPYSMAIALIEAGISPDRFSIYGIDISSRSLHKARNGIYRRNSFREKDIYLRHKYFRADGNSYVLDTRIKELVHFRQGNILDAQFMSDLGMFHVLFCRNVLIYLDEKSRSKALDHIAKQLAADGILFIGHAESGLLDRNIFTAAPYPKAFAFFRAPVTGKGESFAATTEARQLYHRSILARSYRFSTTSRPLPAGNNVFQNKRPVVENRITSKDIQRMIDEGKLQEATNLINKQLLSHGPSAEAFYLLGVISAEAGKSAEATMLLRKAVYLDSEHVDALTLLSLLAEQSGDLNQVQIFNNRIQRLKNKKK
jgi:chemotaxis protein methyltransferase WspC